MDALLLAAREREAMLAEGDQYGQRYTVDFAMRGPGGAATVRSCWIIRTGETVPRLASCYVI